MGDQNISTRKNFNPFGVVYKAEQGSCGGWGIVCYTLGNPSLEVPHTLSPQEAESGAAQLNMIMEKEHERSH